MHGCQELMGFKSLALASSWTAACKGKPFDLAKKPYSSLIPQYWCNAVGSRWTNVHNSHGLQASKYSCCFGPIRFDCFQWNLLGSQRSSNHTLEPVGHHSFEDLVSNHWRTIIDDTAREEFMECRNTILIESLAICGSRSLAWQTCSSAAFPDPSGFRPVWPGSQTADGYRQSKDL